MTESDKERAERVGDPKLQSAYRALGAEEPPRALDEAILGAARHSAQPWTKRWAVPLSLAAVVVLSVVVTLRIQHEQPGIEQPAPVRKEEQVARQAAEPLKPAAEPDKPAAEPAVRAPQQKSMTRKEAQAFPSPAQDRAVAESRVAEADKAPPAVASAPAPRMEAPALAKRADARSEPGSAAGSVAAPPAPATAAPAMRAMQRERVAQERTAAPTPEKELERIAELRKQDKHDEADKALAEFRKRYPEFKIPPAMLERVERR
jgi:hypothetical protein